MLPALPTLGIRFDIDKTDPLPGGYGFASWVIFWRHVDLKLVVGASLYHGDTGDTIGGREYCFCIALQGVNGPAKNRIRTALTNSEDYLRVAAIPPFVEDAQVVSEQLIACGRINAMGEFDGPAYPVGSSLQKARLVR